MRLPMRRGDIVSVALQGDAGKPRPGLIIQSDRLSGSPTVLVIPFSSTVVDVQVRRVTIEPAVTNGLKETSQLMIERMASIRREKCGSVFGHITVEQMAEVEARMVFVLGFAEASA